MFSWTNTRCLYNINLQRLSLQFFLLFFIASASCILADDSSQEQSSDRDTKNKTHARTKENISRLVSLVTAYQEETSDDDDHEESSDDDVVDETYSDDDDDDNYNEKQFFQHGTIIASSMAIPRSNSDNSRTSSSGGNSSSTFTPRSAPSTTSNDTSSSNTNSYYDYNDNYSHNVCQQISDTYTLRLKAIETARIEREKREKIKRKLTTHNYVFQPSTQAAQQLQDVQKAIQKEKNAAAKRSFFESAWHNSTSIFSTNPNTAAEKTARENIAKEEKIWEEKSLQEIEEIEKAQDELLAQHDYTFQPSEQAGKQLKDAQQKFKDAENDRFAFIYKLLFNFNNYEHMEELKEILREALDNVEKEKDTWRVESLQKLANKIKLDKKAKTIEIEREKIRVINVHIKRIKKEEEEEAAQSQALTKKHEPAAPTTWNDSFWQCVGWPKEPEKVIAPELSKNSPLYAKSRNQAPQNSGSGNGNNNNSQSPKKNGGNKNKKNHGDRHIITEIMINGEKYDQHMYLDPKTNLVTSHYAISRDNPDRVYLIRNSTPTLTQTPKTQKLEQFTRAHEEFCNKARNNANQGSLQGRIDNIAARCLRGDISEAQAEHQELELRQKYEQAKSLQQTADRIKADQNALKQEQKAQAKIDKKAAKTERKNQKTIPTPNPATGPKQTPTSNQTATPHNVSPQPATPTEEIAPSPETSPIAVPNAIPTPTPVITPEPNPTQNATTSSDDISSQPATSAYNFEPDLPYYYVPDLTNDDHVDHHKETDAQKLHKDLLKAQESWREKTDLSETSQEEDDMINCMLNAMVDAKNDTTIEFAQAGLRSWEQAQQAQSDEEYAYHVEKSKKYYGLVQNTTPMQSLAQQAQPIQHAELDNLLQDYTKILETHRQEKTFDQPDASLLLQDDAHADRLKKRAQALTESKKQLEINTALPNQTYVVSPQARGFMMANNMNHAAFDGGSVTNFQHCLTQEILGIVESSASIAQKHDCKSIIGQLALQNCNLAISAQQLNQSSRLEEAAAVTDLAHFFDAYAQLLVDADLQSQTMANVNLGIIDGTAQALQKWRTFAQKLCNDPHATICNIADDCKNVGISLYNISAKAYEFTPFAYLDDLNQDMRDSLQALQHHDDDPSADTNPHNTSRTTQRTQRNAQSLKNGLHDALQSAEIVVKNMMNKSLRENVAGATEITVDNFITGKVADTLMNLCGLVGDQVLKAANQLKHNIPSDLQGAVPQFMQTSTGEIIAVAESSGENIGAAVAAKKVADNAQQIIKNAAQTKELIKKVDELTNPDQKKVTALQKELEEVVKATEILNPEKLKSIEGIDQIKKFKDYTNNFTELDKLTPDEVLYLNLCEWLHPKSLEINAKIKGMGLTITEVRDGITCVTNIHEFDIFHSLLGEMRPGSVADATSGGHLFISELKAATFNVDKIEVLQNGYFDLFVKHARGNSTSFKPKTCFPSGYSVEDAMNTIIDTIKNPKNTVLTTTTAQGKQIFDLTNQSNLKFRMYIEKGIVRFSPLSPNA